MLIETKLSYEKLRWQRVRDCVFCIFNERHVAVVGIELWISPRVSRLVFGESSVISMRVESGITLRST